MPSVLWHCWASGRAYDLQKLSDRVLAWLSVWSVVQMICIWSSWCYCHPIISCFSKIQNGLPFWCRLTQVVLEKRPLNICVRVCVCDTKGAFTLLISPNLIWTHFCAVIGWSHGKLFSSQCMTQIAIDATNRSAVIPLKWGQVTNINTA